MKKISVRPKEYEEVFITTLIPYGDCDCIVRLFGKKTGRFGAYMKGGVKPSKRRLGIIQAPSFGLAEFVPPSTAMQMAKLYAVDIHPMCQNFYVSLRSFAFVSYVAEILEVFLPEQEQMPELFELLVELLPLLGCQEPKPQLLRAFELKLLYFCGYLPDLEQEGEEGKPFVAYDPLSCQFLTEGKAGAVDFSQDARKIALQLLLTPLDSLPQVDVDVLKAVGRIFLGRLWLMGKLPLKSVSFLKSIGA